MDSIVSDAKKALCIVQLSNDLPMLRACLGLSQEEIADRIGVSRQTYNAIESGRRPMTWSTCISLVMLFSCFERTKKMMEFSNYCLEVMMEILKGDVS